MTINMDTKKRLGNLPRSLTLATYDKRVMVMDRA
jgi:hypothetical protein